MGNNCAPLLADLILHSYEAEFVQEIFRKGEQFSKVLNLTLRYIDAV